MRAAPPTRMTNSTAYKPKMCLISETDQADWTTRGCVYQNVGSTSMEYDLIPDAYHEIIICDDTGCELPNWFAGSMNNPTTWYACRSSDSYDKLDGIQTHDVLDQWGFTKVMSIPKTATAVTTEAGVAISTGFSAMQAGRNRITDPHFPIPASKTMTMPPGTT